MTWKEHGFEGRRRLYHTTLEVYVSLASVGITGDLEGRSVGFDLSVVVAKAGDDSRCLPR